MNKEALGVIETVGMAAAIQAADTCVKSANVELIGYELTKGSGLVTIKIRGNVGAVKAAIEAAKVSAAKINQVYATLIIPRPAENIEGIIESEETIGIKAKEAEIKDTIEEENKLENTVDMEEKIEDKVEDSTNVETEEKVEDNDASLDSPRSPEVFQEEKVSNEKEQDKESTHNDSYLNEQENNEVCNICHDPACTRKKGQPKTLCINYKGNRR
ncbi:microcompartment protein [Clostridium carboxidivorans P7]|uniref:Microcompartments protein n=1 Tax=Clostridium carboxidivorans P7 TaxID=536227 RepID=C6PQK0_9CLOT|nr:BMC domain-containing protein [Clostridium carboxidivorans]AKN30410.1 microcompartment protein [Clostridium carboxidivorans P7]EET88522.1 microcompartments protein [Clostridium carboxidivorans P7]EFG86148.1 BMC domain protein [Clostridium carboxidivorans P7]